MVCYLGVALTGLSGSEVSFLSGHVVLIIDLLSVTWGRIRVSTGRRSGVDIRPYVYL